MTETEADTSSTAWNVTHVPARDIPVPPLLSEQAQAYLSMLGGQGGGLPFGDASAEAAAPTDPNEMLLPIYESWAAEGSATAEDTEVDGVPVYVCTPEGFDESDTRVFLEIHGGGFAMGGGILCQTLGRAWATRFDARMWSVDYRMPPAHPFPAALDDCVTVYRALLRDHDPNEVIVGGGSAGGNLAAALVLRARDEGLPLPAAAVLLSPVTDLTWSFDSSATNWGVDGLIGHDDGTPGRMYAAGHPLDDPYLSPLFGDFSKGYPPTFLQTGTRDLLLSCAVSMHRRLRAAGREAELHVWEAMPHGGFFGSPEDDEVWAEVRYFTRKHWG